MQARVCVQNFDNGDVQGFLFIDTGSGESLVTTSPIYESGGKGSNGFPIMGTSGQVDVTAFVDLNNSEIEFTVTIGSQAPSMFTQALMVSSATC